MTSTPEKLTVTEKTPSLMVNIHDHEVVMDNNNQNEVMKLLCDWLIPGAPVLIETNPITTKPGEAKEIKRVLFLSDGAFGETGEFCAQKGKHGCAIATINPDGSYDLTHRDGNHVISGNALKQNAINNIRVGGASLLSNFEVICALKFAEDSIYINASSHYAHDQQMNPQMTFEFVKKILSESTGNKPAMVRDGGRWRKVNRNGIGIRTRSEVCGPEGYTIGSGHMIEPSDYIVYEDHLRGKNLGYLKLDSTGNAFFLPRRSMREFAEAAFSPDFIKQFFPEA